LWTVIRRWPTACIATAAALGFPILLYIVGSEFNPMFPNVVIFVLGLPLVWPMALLAVALPAFWCDGLGPFAAIGKALRISRRRVLRMVGAIFATACLVLVFYVLAAIAIGIISQLIGRADLFVIATIRSMISAVIGAFGVPFVLAMLVVAYEDLKLRDLERRKVSA
jgi:membrane-anchored glycerophosphoryl diester phosphodiesterase (GDPDase)